MSNFISGTKNGQKTGLASGINKRLIIVNLVVGCVSYVLLSCIMAVILMKVDLDPGSTIYLTYISCALCAFLTAFCTIRIIQKNGMAFGAVSVLPTYVIILLVGLLAGGKVSYQAALILLIMAIFGAIGGIIAVNKKKKKRKR